MTGSDSKASLIQLRERARYQQKDPVLRFENGPTIDTGTRQVEVLG
jgi:hypothetical protein